MLYSALHNRSLNALLDNFWLVFHAVPVRSVTTDLRPTTTLQDHREILAALRQHDAPLARQRIQDHFHSLEDRLAKAGAG
jgi:DNA-binding FadR family transcriptional regulator